MDPERRALERRFELAKERFLSDLSQAQRIVRRAAGTATRSVVRVGLAVGGLALGGLVLGIVAAVVRRRRRASFRWR